MVRCIKVAKKGHSAASRWVAERTMARASGVMVMGSNPAWVFMFLFFPPT